MIFFLQLRNELIKLFAKKRTYIGFGMFLLAQNAIIIIFRFSKATATMQRMLEGNGYLPADYLSALTLSTMMVITIAYTLLGLYVALVGGDLVSKEVEDGTMRMILSRPISRVRLVILKWLAGIVFSIALVAVLGISGWLFASIWFPPTGGLFAWMPGEIFAVHGFWTGVQHYAAAHAVMVVKAVTIMTLALMFSCFNMKPAAATILALSLMLINGILMEIPYFRDFRHWFLTYHLNVWRLLLDEHVQWWRVLSSLCVMGGCNVTFLAIGCGALHWRDIKS
jgi:ABC-2 type transport system permease protein